MNLNLAEYRDKVMGCWLGKNIGGTLGTPYEGQPEMNDATGYTNIIPGEPLPNDDLDLQLVWLLAAEENTVLRLTPNLLGEYWFKFITGPWNEYGVCRANIANGFNPPLSGAINNEKWRYSNGAWIRSEIWACLAPGAPDEAIRLAYMDACCDHMGEGIYAEFFTAALESAAFVVSGIREIIDIALAKIPSGCRVARAVNLARAQYEAGADLKTARAAVVADSADLGFFQAPANVAFCVLGLLYGEGDFSKSVIAAVNCGDDTDCTGATVGSVMGILRGAKAIPAKWIEPIGTSLRTIAVNNVYLDTPKTLEELARRVELVALAAQRENPENLLAITDAPTDAPSTRELLDSQAAQRLWALSPYALTFELPWCHLVIDYEGGPDVVPGAPKKFKVRVRQARPHATAARFAFQPPEGWTFAPGAAFQLLARDSTEAWIDMEVTPGPFTDGAIEYIPLVVRPQDRCCPYTVAVPFQLSGAVTFQGTGCRSYAGEPADYPDFFAHRHRLYVLRKR